MTGDCDSPTLIRAVAPCQTIGFVDWKAVQWCANQAVDSFVTGPSLKALYDPTATYRTQTNNNNNNALSLPTLTLLQFRSLLALTVALVHYMVNELGLEDVPKAWRQVHSAVKGARDKSPRGNRISLSPASTGAI
eukprot:c55069_g1_i1.p1 GENE.c55069_g1_i1~~c55069_g1_i1.p1  ORF type:complete len:151 (+),score=32.65 c55069_g1_i1:51-455(+)